MNLYFVFEGKTEPKLYRKWLQYLLPEYDYAQTLEDVTENKYFFETANGIPSCYDIAVNAIEEINGMPIFDYLILCIDAERLTIEERLDEVNFEIQSKLVEKNIANLNSKCDFKVIVQNVCIETWLLGNSKIADKQPERQKLREFVKFYNVAELDPELLPNSEIFGYATTAKFHEGYLRELFKEKKINYSKTRPGDAQKEYYLNELIKRTNTTKHIDSFNSLLDLCREMNRNDVFA